MPRINIEDKLFKDPRWTRLLIFCADKHKALGLLTDAWIIAQTHWLKYGCIPEKAWPKELEVLIEVELAEKKEDGSVYVKGSKRSFEWLEQRVEAGRKGGKKRGTNAQAVAKQSLDPAKQKQANSSKSNPPTLTPTLLTATTPNKVDAMESVKLFMTWWNKAAEEIDIIKVYESPDNVALIARHIAENPDMEFWKKAINAISLDSFYQGSNKSKARMNIGWFFKNRTVANLMDVHETKKDLFKGVLDD
jgi:hypothetical protein